MLLPIKIYINFHTQVFNTFSRISGIKIIDFQMSDKTSDGYYQIFTGHFKNLSDIVYMFAFNCSIIYQPLKQSEKKLFINNNIKSHKLNKWQTNV